MSQVAALIDEVVQVVLRVRDARDSTSTSTQANQTPPLAAAAALSMKDLRAALDAPDSPFAAQLDAVREKVVQFATPFPLPGLDDF